jgi:hypothetical protein
MRPLSAAQLLDAWERGLSAPKCRRALPLLAAASLDSSTETAAALTIGERDRSLLTLREWTFGQQLASVAICPKCSERLEWMIDTRVLRVSPEAELSAAASFEIDDYQISFRVPNTLDVEAAAAGEDAVDARRRLLERCVTAATYDGVNVPAADLPDKLVHEIARRMGQADPQADVQMELTCPACSHCWQVIFDIEAFFWSEIDAWSQRLLSEVHLLACAYGWRESDILNLTPWRRQFYLGLVTG